MTTHMTAPLMAAYTASDGLESAQSAKCESGKDMFSFYRDGITTANPEIVIVLLKMVPIIRLAKN